MIERALAEDPAAARALGLDYLRGHLLHLLDRRQEALEAFAATMSSTPELGAHSRYRLALEQEKLGHPEVAAGLVATLLRSGPPKTLVGPAMRLLRRTVLAGGDCRVLRGLEPSKFRTTDRRELTLARAECQARNNDLAGALSGWQRLLEDDRADPVARVAAERLAAAEPEKKSARTHMLIGLAFHHHREFNTAVYHLARALVQVPASRDIGHRELWELRYALARSHFWEARYPAAAAAFGAVAEDMDDPRRKAQALYQKARCYELSGRWEEAVRQFREAYLAEPSGRSADATLIAGMRLEWLLGREEEALGHLEKLLAKRHYNTASRALLFLAATDVLNGRSDRAGPWLRQARELRRVPPREVHYWQGRLAELKKDPADAVGHFLKTIRDDPYHPLAHGARLRLRGETLAPVALVTAREKAASASLGEVYDAWLLLPPNHPLHPKVRQNLEHQLVGERSVTSFLDLEVKPVSDWPLWGSRLDRPEEMLLALGLFQEGGSVVLRHFPVARPELAFTGSLILARTGDTRRSLYIAEILSKRVPNQLPRPLLPLEFRRLLYPFAYQDQILSEADRRKIDPHLLAGIIREESRFDPRAFSMASARGLTQFVFPTAREVASRHEIGEVAPQDLERPEIAIALGAAYLHQLHEEFGGSLPEVVAAYNAGEPQSKLWRRYCISDEPEEYLTKVAFRETRNYLAKVLTSRAQYHELYPLSPVRVAGKR